MARVRWCVSTYLDILQAEVVLVFEVGSPGTQLHQHLGDLRLYCCSQPAGRLHDVFLHVLQLHSCFGIVRVPEHTAEQVCEEGAGPAEHIEGIQVLGDALLDVCNRGSGARRRWVAAARHAHPGAYGRRSRARGGQGGAQGPAQLRHLVLLVLLHFLLGPAEQKATLVVHFTFLRTTTIHKWCNSTGSCCFSFVYLPQVPVSFLQKDQTKRSWNCSKLRKKTAQGFHLPEAHLSVPCREAAQTWVRSEGDQKACQAEWNAYMQPCCRYVRPGLKTAQTHLQILRFQPQTKLS